MWLNWIVLLSFPYVRCLLYIDRVEVESNPALVNSTLIYFHDATGNCVTTATFTTFFPITKMLLYIKIKFAEDRNDKEYKRQIVSSVVEIDKVLKGLQSNMFIIHFFQDIRNSMDFKFRLPLPPGTYGFINISFDTSHYRIIPELPAMVDLRFVGKIKGSNQNKFLSHVTVYGGYRQG